MDIYTELIIDLYKNPLNRRAISNAEITHSGANVTCGDRVRVYVKIDSQGTIEDASFEGEGCAISIASASLITEEMKGKKIDEVLDWNSVNLFEWLGVELGAARIKCSLLPLETVQEGLRPKM